MSSQAQTGGSPAWSRVSHAGGRSRMSSQAQTGSPRGVES